MTAAKTGRGKRKILLGVVIGVVVLLVIASFAGGWLLFDFALDAESPRNIARAIAAAGPETEAGAEALSQSADQVHSDTRLWQDYSAAAEQWFEEYGQPRTLTAADGTFRRSSFFRQEGHLYAIVCHGYGGDSLQMAGHCRMLYEMGLSVLAPDALAHGDSDGRYIGMGWPERLDLLGWIHQLVEADPQAEIMLLGVSMGGATVMMTAGEELPANVKCIVEDCGYSSVMDEFAVQIGGMFGLPRFPLLYTADLVCRLRAGYWFGEASAVEQLKKATVPMLFIHGEQDDFVPYAMLDQVYEACASPVKEKLSVPGAGHGAASVVDPVKYWNTIEGFMARFMDLELEE